MGEKIFLVEAGCAEVRSNAPTQAVTVCGQ
jgi:hypothetical protein